MHNKSVERMYNEFIGGNDKDNFKIVTRKIQEQDYSYKNKCQKPYKICELCGKAPNKYKISFVPSSYFEGGRCPDFIMSKESFYVFVCSEACSMYFSLV